MFDLAVKTRRNPEFTNTVYYNVLKFKNIVIILQFHRGERAVEVR